MNTLRQAIPLIAVSLAVGACDPAADATPAGLKLRRAGLDSGPSLESDSDSQSGTDTGGGTDSGGEPPVDCDVNCSGVPSLYTLHERAPDPNNPGNAPDTQLLRIDSTTGVGTEICTLPNNYNYSTSVIIPWLRESGERIYPMIAWNNADQRIEIIDMCDCSLTTVWDAAGSSLPGIAPLVVTSGSARTTASLVAVDVENDQLLVLELEEDGLTGLPKVDTTGVTAIPGIKTGNADATIVYPGDDLFDAGSGGLAQVLLRQTGFPTSDPDEMWVIPWHGGNIFGSEKGVYVQEHLSSPVVDDPDDCFPLPPDEHSNFQTLGFTQMETPPVNAIVDTGFYLCGETGDLLSLKRHCTNATIGQQLFGLQEVGSDPISAATPGQCNDLAHEPLFYAPAQSCF